MKTKTIIKDSLIIIFTLAIFIIWAIIYFAIDSINTAWGCIWDYVEKLHKKELTWWCGRYCDWEYHQDKCDKSFKDIGCQLVAKTDWCSISLYNSYWNDKPTSDKIIYYTVNSIACRVDYLWVWKFGNRNWREILNSKLY